MTTLRIRVLGTFSVDGMSTTSVGSRKARTMLQRLALARGRPVAVDTLVDALWDDDLPERPAAQLAVLASRLRTVLGKERITYDDAGYTLHSDWLDLDELERVVIDAEQRLDGPHPAGAGPAATGALDLVRGVLLPEQLDAPWTHADRALATRLLARARHAAARAALSCNEPLRAIDVAQAALAGDEYDEVALRLAMTANVAAGRTAAALAVYAAFRQRLIEELGADPSPPTEQLHTAILRGELAVEVRRERVRGHAVGRDSECSRLLAATRTPPNWTSVSGEPGIGKSTLLDSVADAAADDATVLRATCAEAARTLPMQPVVDALADHLRVIGPEAAAAVLRGDGDVLGPLLGTGGGGATSFTATPLGMATIFASIATLFSRIERPLLIVDDLHYAATISIECLDHLRRHVPSLTIVTSHRAGELPRDLADETLTLGPLDIDATRLLVGTQRSEELLQRSGGNPLFLLELAAAPDLDAVPSGIVDTVAQRAVALGEGEITIRAAAVLGSSVDLELLAGVVQLPAVKVLEQLEAAARCGLLDEGGASFTFRHALIREALAAATSSARRAFIHREAGRLLAQRADHDPMAVAFHAQLGGDQTLAGSALVAAAARARAQFSEATAEALLDQAVALTPTREAHLERALVRTSRAKYREAIADATIALQIDAGADAMEIAAWAAYFARDFDDARGFADDGVAMAGDERTRASCLVVAGRVRHARGDLVGAEPRLVEAAEVARGIDRAAATAWLGVLRSHQSRTTEAVQLLEGVTRSGGGPERTNVLLHALMFLGHAHAMGGRPALALEQFARLNSEIERREFPRFAGRAHNFRGWVLRQLGATAQADDANLAALELDEHDIPETVMAGELDLAEGCLVAGDVDRARARLLVARTVGEASETLAFGWRQLLKVRELEIRLLLTEERDADAFEQAARLAADAQAIGVPRYAVGARLLSARAGARLGKPLDHDAIDRELATLDSTIGVEAWWRAAELARDTGVERWHQHAERAAASLAAESAGFGDALLTTFDRRYGR